MKTLRKTAITIAMAAIACAVFTACGTGNDDGAVQPKEVVATKAVVTTAAEQTEAKKTTTTTEAIEDSEPETEKTTTTTTEVTENSEPETEVTTMADNPEGMYPMEECFRRKVEEISGSKVLDIEMSPMGAPSCAIVEDGRKFKLAPGDLAVYKSGELTDINDYIESEFIPDGYEGRITYAPKSAS